MKSILKRNFGICIMNEVKELKIFGNGMKS